MTNHQSTPTCVTNFTEAITRYESAHGPLTAMERLVAMWFYYEAVATTSTDAAERIGAIYGVDSDDPTAMVKEKK